MASGWDVGAGARPAGREVAVRQSAARTLLSNARRKRGPAVRPAKRKNVLSNRTDAFKLMPLTVPALHRDDFRRYPGCHADRRCRKQRCRPQVGSGTALEANSTPSAGRSRRQTMMSAMGFEACSDFVPHFSTCMPMSFWTVRPIRVTGSPPPTTCRPVFIRPPALPAR